MIKTNIEWIGDIPVDWKLERLQWHMDEIKDNNRDEKTTQILSLTNTRGVIPYEEKGAQGNNSKDDYTQYKLAYPNTIVANSMNILIGSVGKCNYFGCVSPVYYVFKPKENENIDYLNYIFQTQQFQKELRRYANGILEIRLRVSSNDILKRYVPYPSIEIQNKIVETLTIKEKQISDLIKNTETQIEKLKEYKKAYITKAVTKGIKEYSSYKKTNSIWVEEIPSHWEIKKLKYIVSGFSKGSGITKEDIVVDGDIACIRYGEIYTKYNYNFDKCVTKTNLNRIASPKHLEYGDILFSATGELVEEIGKSIVYLGTEDALVGGDIIVAKHNENPLFMSYALDSIYSQMQKSYGKSKLKVVHASAEGMGNIQFVLPPLIEQEQIGLHLRAICDSIDELIKAKQQKIEKLNEYKKSLIYEYVTGKREVKEG